MEAAELFARAMHVEDQNGDISELVVRFHAPVKNPDGDDYVAHANISCRFFERDVYGIGEDAAQAFFWLPNVVVSYLIGRRRFGYESYWFEKGDLDFTNFWTYRE